MARTRPVNRLNEILESAASVFMRLGYRGARVDLVAQEAGVAAGTVLLYAASKESLFDLVVRREFGAELPREPGPYAVASSATIINDAWIHLESIARFPQFDAALECERPEDAREELRAVVTELYDWIAQYWRGLRIVERCATEWPELHAHFYHHLRRPQLARFVRYLDRRAEQGFFRRTPDSAIAARVVLENIAFFAMHRHTAPDSQDLGGQEVKETVLDMILASLLVPAPMPPPPTSRPHATLRHHSR